MPSMFSGWYTVASVGVVYLRADGKVYNFTSAGWDAVPPSGVIPPTSIQPITKPLSAGPLASNFFFAFPDIASNIDNVEACVVALDPGGLILSQIDQWPSPYLALSLAGRGGFRRV